jgi:hypothetical protein
MSAGSVWGSRPSRSVISLGLALFASTLLLGSGGPLSKQADAAYTHANYLYNPQNYYLNRHDPFANEATMHRWHIRGGFVQTCWYMRAVNPASPYTQSRNVYSRVRMAAQLPGGGNKQTVEKVIDGIFRLYCDANTAKHYNSTDVEAWLRLLDGKPVFISGASARALTQGR